MKELLDKLKKILDTLVQKDVITSDRKTSLLKKAKTNLDEDFEKKFNTILKSFLQHRGHKDDFVKENPKYYGALYDSLNKFYNYYEDATTNIDDDNTIKGGGIFTTLINILDLIAIVIGLIPGVGIVTDIIAVILNLVIGDYIGLILSLLEIIPGLGIIPGGIEIIWKIYRIFFRRWPKHHSEERHHHHRRRHHRRRREESEREKMKQKGGRRFGKGILSGISHSEPHSLFREKNHEKEKDIEKRRRRAHERNKRKKLEHEREKEKRKQEKLKHEIEKKKKEREKEKQKQIEEEKQKNIISFPSKSHSEDKEKQALKNENKQLRKKLDILMRTRNNNEKSSQQNDSPSQVDLQSQIEAVQKLRLENKEIEEQIEKLENEKKSSSKGHVHDNVNGNVNEHVNGNQSQRYIEQWGGSNSSTFNRSDSRFGYVPYKQISFTSNS